MGKLAQGEIEERPGRDDVLGRDEFPQVPENGQGRRARLDFIQEEQRPAGDDRAALEEANLAQQPVRVPSSEERMERALPFQVQPNHRVEVPAAPVLDQIRLSDLSGAPDDQGLPARPGLPVAKVELCRSQHYDCILTIAVTKDNHQ